jgi:hypothetical protein
MHSESRVKVPGARSPVRVSETALPASTRPRRSLGASCVRSGLAWAFLRELAQRMVADPHRGGIRGRRQSACDGDRGVQRRVARSDGSQRHVHGFRHEVTIVGGCLLDQFQSSQERPIVRGLVVDRQSQSSANAARLMNSARRVAYLSTFVHACGVRSKSTKQTVSQTPQLSKSRLQRSILCGRHECRIVDVRGQQACFVRADAHSASANS